LGNAFLNGWVGVDLFFVLSGYLISSHLIRNQQECGFIDARRYFAGRFLRIAPAYFSAIVLIALGAFPLYRVSHDELGLRIGYHLLFLQDYLPSNINVAFWSLGVEEKFYIAAPLIIWACLSRRKLWQRLTMVTALAAAATVLRMTAFAGMPDGIGYETFFTYLRSPFHLCMEPLAAGVAIAMIRAYGGVRASPNLGKVFVVISAAVLLLWLPTENFMALIDWRDVAIQPILIAALFALFVSGTVLMFKVPLPFEPIFRTVARLSYTLYLVHIPTIPLSMAMANNGNNRLILFWTTYVLCSISAALVLHYLIEKPFLLLKTQMEHDGRGAMRGTVAVT